MVLEIVYHVALLVGASVLLQGILRRLSPSATSESLLIGVLYGTLAILAMLRPIDVVHGVMLDGRFISVAVAGVFGGPIAALVAAVPAALFRLYLGGAGTAAGVTAIFATALLSGGFYYVRGRLSRFGDLPALWAHGVVVHSVVLLLAFLMVDVVGDDLIRQMALPILVVFPLGLVFVAWFMLDYEKQTTVAEKLRQSEGRFRGLFEGNLVPILVVDPESGRVVDANPAAVEYYGWPKERLLEKRIGDLDAGGSDSAPQIEAVCNGLAERFIGKQYRADGSVRDVEVYCGTFLAEETELLYTVVIDQQDRAEAQSALLESQADLMEAQRMAHIGRWEHDFATGELRWSAEIGQMYESDTASVKVFTDTVHPEDRERVEASYLEAVESGSPSRIEHRLVMKDGRVKWIAVHCRIDYDEERRPLRSRGIAQDVTLLKEAEEALRRRVDYEAAVVECMRLLLVRGDFDAQLERVLRVLLDVSGVCRTYIFRNVATPWAGDYLSQTLEVVASGCAPHADSPRMQMVPYEEWAPSLVPCIASRSALARDVDDLGESDPLMQAVLIEQDVESVLVLPVFVEDEFWGLIGFDECRAKRDWDGSCLDGSLSAASSVIYSRSRPTG